MNNKNRKFSPTDLYNNYLKNHLKATSVDKILNNKNFDSLEEKEIALKGFVEYVIDVHNNNLELDDTVMHNLNKSALMYLGVIKNNENENNYIEDPEVRSKLAEKILDNMLMARNIDREFLGSMYRMRQDLENLKKYQEDLKNGVITKDDKKILEDSKFLLEYFDEKRIDLLDAKIAKASKLDSGEKIDMLSFMLKRHKHDFVNIEQLKEKYKDDYDMKVALDDINNLEFPLEKNKTSISEKNNDLFLKETIIQRDYLYWQEQFNKKISNMNLEKQTKLDKIGGKLWNKGKLDDNGRDFSLFSTNYVALNPDNGAIQSVLEMPKMSKKIVSPMMPQDDEVYEAMAIASKMKGIREPVINVNERSAENRKEFVQKTIRELLKVGYDIDSITVPKDLEQYRLAFKTMAQGISERSELTQQDLHILNQNQAELTLDSVSKEEDIKKQKISDELKQKTQETDKEDISADELLNAAKVGNQGQKNKIPTAQEVNHMPDVDVDNQMTPPMTRDEAFDQEQEDINSYNEMLSNDVSTYHDNIHQEEHVQNLNVEGQPNPKNIRLEHGTVGEQLIALAINKADKDNIFSKNIHTINKTHKFKSDKEIPNGDKVEYYKRLNSDFANTVKNKIIDEILKNREVLEMDVNQLDLLASNKNDGKRINKEVAIAINEALKEIDSKNLTSRELDLYKNGKFKTRDLDMSDFNIESKRNKKKLK